MRFRLNKYHATLNFKSKFRRLPKTKTSFDETLASQKAGLVRPALCEAFFENESHKQN